MEAGTVDLELERKNWNLREGKAWSVVWGGWKEERAAKRE